VKDYEPITSFGGDVGATYDDAPRGAEDVAVAFLEDLAGRCPALRNLRASPRPDGNTSSGCSKKPVIERVIVSEFASLGGERRHMMELEGSV
jgi:hypothetical protein